MLWSLSSPNSKGVGIYFSNNLSFNLEHFDFDPFGRYVKADVDIDGTHMRIVSVYAPNNAAERKNFFNDIYH